jgi:enoyl-CoA hydratase
MRFANTRRIDLELENLKYEKSDHIATITINREKVLNALSFATVGEMDAAFAEAERDDDVGVVIVTGAGEKSFVAGADISEINSRDAQSGYEMAQRGQRTLRRLETMGKPSIAAINGFALGGGCELAMACTIRIAADNAKFGQPEVNLGVIPGYAGTQRLPRIVGPGIATDLILTGRAIDAQEALRIGLVSQVVGQAELMDTARKTASQILKKGPVAIRAAMESIDRGLNMGFEDGCGMEATLFGLVCGTDDMKEGTSAFLEKRKPDFKGR